MIAVGMVATLALAGCDSDSLGRKYPAYRYRLTAVVETPEGARTGSSVIEVHWTEAGPAFGIQSGAGYSVHGEAVAVDLPGGQTLFVLLRSSDNSDWAAWALQDVVPNVKDLRGADRQPHSVPRQVEVLHEQVDNYPMFVRFANSADPMSVEQVAPEDLAKAFGSGYRLKSLTVQVTDDAVTTGIAKKLGDNFWVLWGAQHKAEMVKGDPSRNSFFKSLAGTLSRNDFVKSDI